MAKVIGVIPARLGSQRLPNKALLALDGQPLLFWVWRNALRSKALDRLVIATDSEEIACVAEGFGAEALMTSRRARNGTERTAEVATEIRGDIYVNIQGDNVRFPSGWLARGLAGLRSARGQLFHTLASRIRDDYEIADKNKVKVALIETVSRGRTVKRAGWFSRSTLPHIQQRVGGEMWRSAKYYKHLGFYFYRRAGLLKYATWKPGTHEKAESLEQLRILERGGEIGVSIVSGKCFTVDSRKDFAALPRSRE